MQDHGADRPVLTITEQAFEHLVTQAIDSIGAPFGDLMDNVAIFIEARNPEESTILGLYEGTPLTEREAYGAMFEMPDRVTIYRDALLDFCESQEELRHEVQVTVVHELAHHFGIDDDRLHELGWG